LEQPEIADSCFGEVRVAAEDEDSKLKVCLRGELVFFEIK